MRRQGGASGRSVASTAAEVLDDGGDGDDPVEFVAVVLGGRIGEVVAGELDEVFVELDVHDAAEGALVAEVGHDDFAVGGGAAGEDDGDVAVGEFGFHGVAAEADAEGAVVGDVAGDDFFPVGGDFVEVGGLGGLGPGEDGEVAEAVSADVAVDFDGGGFFDEVEAGAKGVAGGAAAFDLGEVAAVDADLACGLGLGHALADAPEAEAFGEVIVEM